VAVGDGTGVAVAIAPPGVDVGVCANRVAAQTMVKRMSVVFFIF
jgi:hypothetical protein